jgi:Lrp/AsnC family transcriptional regulator for asnA, asnC and gidA
VQEKNKIDQTDAKILKLLLKEARTSFTEIAKECNISIGAVRVRYEKLKKEGIIKGEIMQINPHSLGYKCVADLGILTSAEDEAEVREFLKSKPYLPAAYAHYGKFNLGAIIVLPSIEKLSKILEIVSANPKVKRINALIWTDTTNMDYPENLTIKPLTTQNTPQHTTKNSQENNTIYLDDTDREIAKILSQNARTPFSNIAKQLNISTKKVIQRYNRLRKNLLTISTITIDLNQLGYNATCHIFIKAADLSKIPQIQTQILQIPNTILLVRLLGIYDLKAVIAIENFENLFNLTNQLHSIKGIETFEIYPFKPFKNWPLNIFTPLLNNQTPHKDLTNKT